MNRDLFQINADIAYILENGADENGEITDETIEELRSLHIAKTELIGQIGLDIKNREARIATKKDYIEQWKRDVEADTDTIKRLKEMLLSEVKSLDDGKYKDDVLTMYTSKHKSVKCKSDTPDLDNLPDEFKKVTVEPRKTEIKKALEKGEAVGDWYISEDESLTIRMRK